jgi:hypothetical protein
LLFALLFADAGFHNAQNSPLKMRTAPFVLLLHDPKPSFGLFGFKRTACALSAPLQSSTVLVQFAASGPEMVHEAASDASVGVVAVESKLTLAPGGDTGSAMHPWVSYCPVVVLKNWHTSGTDALAEDAGMEKVMGVFRLDGA